VRRSNVRWHPPFRLISGEFRYHSCRQFSRVLRAPSRQLNNTIGDQFSARFGLKLANGVVGLAHSLCHFRMESAIVSKTSHRHRTRLGKWASSGASFAGTTLGASSACPSAASERVTVSSNRTSIRRWIVRGAFFTRRVSCVLSSARATRSASKTVIKWSFITPSASRGPYYEAGPAALSAFCSRCLYSASISR
jgi:hypothetical protein